MPAAPDPASSGAPRLEYETRFIPITTAGATATVLPYVLEAIATLGYGSAVAVGDKGIQLTLPVQMMHFLDATIATLVSDAPLAPYEENVFFPPVIKVPGVPISIKPMVDALGIVPPDMAIQWLSLGTSGALLVSGPKERLDYYRKNVLPGLKTLVNGLQGDA
jgi:hypothetical protein